MKSRTWMWIIPACLFAALTIPSGSDAQNTPDHQPPIITFDPQGSIFTFPTSINPAGVIAGAYEDANGEVHGFLRAHDGKFTALDPAGSTFTEPFSISPDGAITGDYSDVNFVFHGFLRAHDGQFTTFDAPGSVNGTSPS